MSLLFNKHILYAIVHLVTCIFSFTGYAYRKCESNSLWVLGEGLNKTWANYTECIKSPGPNRERVSYCQIIFYFYCTLMQIFPLCINHYFVLLHIICTSSTYFLRSFTSCTLWGMQCPLRLFWWPSSSLAILGEVVDLYFMLLKLILLVHIEDTTALQNMIASKNILNIGKFSSYFSLLEFLFVFKEIEDF